LNLRQTASTELDAQLHPQMRKSTLMEMVQIPDSFLHYMDL